MRDQVNTPVKEGSMSARNRSSCRTPMQWDSSANAGFSTVPKDQLYLPIDPDVDRPIVEAEENAHKSVLNYVRGLISLRKSVPAIGYAGEWKYVGSIRQQKWRPQAHT